MRCPRIGTLYILSDCSPLVTWEGEARETLSGPQTLDKCGKCWYKSEERHQWHLRGIYLPDMFETLQRSGKSETRRAVISESCWLQAHPGGPKGPLLIIPSTFGGEGGMTRYMPDHPSWIPGMSAG